MKIKSLKLGCATVVGALCILVLFWYFCRPAVVLHYSASGDEPIGYFYDTDVYISKRSLYPGESVKYYTDWHQGPDYWTMISFPFESRDSVEINGPFSRVDVCIGAGAKVERTEIRHGFFDRFTALRESCEHRRLSDNGSAGTTLKAPTRILN